MESYTAVKHLHVTAAYLSIIFFVLRAFWSVSENSVLNARWVKIAPHIIDTALLAFGVALAVMLNFWPLPGWLAAKIVALVIYIVLGTIAIKRGANARHSRLFRCGGDHRICLHSGRCQPAQRAFVACRHVTQ